jgi:hypothetical protein
MRSHKFLILVSVEIVLAHILVYIVIKPSIEHVLHGLGICLSIWWFIYLIYLIIKVTKKL